MLESKTDSTASKTIQEFFYNEPQTHPLDEFWELFTIHYPIRITEKGLIEQLRSLEDYEETTPEGLSVLHGCCAYGLNDAIRLLLNWGADKGLASQSGYTPLIACMADMDMKIKPVARELIFEIIDSGVDLNAVCNKTFYRNYRTTAFIEAACDGYLDVVEKLFCKGASYELDEDQGRNALPSAYYTGRIEALEYLISIGCNASTLKETDLSNWFHASEADIKSSLKVLMNNGLRMGK